MGRILIPKLPPLGLRPSGYKEGGGKKNKTSQHSHEVRGDSVGAAGDGFELHALQVHVFGQTPLQHVS